MYIVEDDNIAAEHGPHARAEIGIASLTLFAC
jgi:hypothetical protein